MDGPIRAADDRSIRMIESNRMKQSSTSEKWLFESFYHSNYPTTARSKNAIPKRLKVAGKPRSFQLSTHQPSPPALIIKPSSRAPTIKSTPLTSTVKPSPPALAIKLSPSYTNKPTPSSMNQPSLRYPMTSVRDRQILSSHLIPSRSPESTDRGSWTANKDVSKKKNDLYKFRRIITAGRSFKSFTKPCFLIFDQHGNEIQRKTNSK
ncbi:Hypothetical protein CINCED_3A006929 [Cinara cedri]|uniref:Uncharacterized protein n=1 Tax=Cinara cedri TaxID=506608 RepID=A0A5E4NJN9_9HEMI|nr:Hypothetical protein CINCED_3A006929 [Cinara cedri]